MNGEEILDLVRLKIDDANWPHYVEINEAYEAICRRAGWWVQRIRDETSLTFQNGVASYALPVSRIRRLESIWVQNNQDQTEWRPMQEIDDLLFERYVYSYRKNDGTEIVDVPRFYRLQGGEAEQLNVTPTPDGTYVARLVYLGNPEKIGRLTVPSIPHVHHRLIAIKAAASIMRNRGKAGDAEKAMACERDAEEGQLGIAFDIASASRSGTGMPKRHIMRS